MNKKNKLCFIVASEMTVKAFLCAQIIALSEYYDITLVVNTNETDFAKVNGLKVTVIPLVIEREINLIADVRALFFLVKTFRKYRFNLVHSVTPKAGLLAMLAGKMARTPLRVHTFTGQVWATRTGFSRWLLKTMDRLLAASATYLLADSFSQRQFLIDQGVATEQKLTVLAEGSISGVDVDRFKPDDAVRKSVRGKLSIADDEVLLLFLGRLNRDKGVVDLVQAVAAMAGDKLHLLLVGPDEAGLKAELQEITAACADHVHFVDYTDSPERYFAAADIFCLPSYREGFGSVIIEAAACGLPAIGSNIYGISDAVNEGETGLLFPPGNITALKEAIKQMVVDSVARERMGQAALRRARKDFTVKRLVDAWLDYYDGLL